MGDRGHNRHGPERGGCCAPFAGRELSLRLTQCDLGRGLRPYQVASWSIQPFGHNRHHGPKIGWGLCPFGGRAGSPSNTKSPGPSLPSIPNGILIHSAIWRCGRGRSLHDIHVKFHVDPSNRLATIHQRYRQTGLTDNGPIAWGEPF